MRCVVRRGVTEAGIRHRQTQPLLQQHQSRDAILTAQDKGPMARSAAETLRALERDGERRHRDGRRDIAGAGNNVVRQTGMVSDMVQRCMQASGLPRNPSSRRSASRSRAMRAAVFASGKIAKNKRSVRSRNGHPSRLVDDSWANMLSPLASAKAKLPWPYIESMWTNGSLDQLPITASLNHVRGGSR
jgi:hypothetical protein